MKLEPKDKTKPQTYSLNSEAINKLEELADNYNTSKSYIINQLIIDNYDDLIKYKVSVCKNCGARYHIPKKQDKTNCEICNKVIE